MLGHFRELVVHTLKSMTQAFETGIERFLIRSGRKGLRRGRHLVVVNGEPQVPAPEGHRRNTGENEEVLVRNTDLIRRVVVAVNVRYGLYQVHDRHTIRQSRCVRMRSFEEHKCTPGNCTGVKLHGIHP
jgi:hypothetical protein